VSFAAYSVIDETNLDDFEAEIADAVANGWELSGNLVVYVKDDNQHYCQAMILPH
jgi:hypothetical protein